MRDFLLGLARDEAALARLFGARTCENGLAYAQSGRVRDLIATGEGASWSLAATVRGNSGIEYHTRLTAARDALGEPSLSSQCTCPVGVRCKHAVAVLVTWAEQLRESDPDLLPIDVERLLRGVERAAEGRSGDVLADRKLAFLLEASAADPLQLTVRVGMVREGRGGYVEFTDTTTFMIGQARAEGRIPRELARLAQEVLSARLHFGAVGHGLAEDLVDEILRSATWFWGKVRGQPWTLDQPRPIRWTWRGDEHAHFRLTSEVTGANQLVGTGRRMWYVDEPARTMGVIERAPPLRVMTDLARLPALTPAQLARVQARLKRVPSLSELPEPPDLGGPTRIETEPRAQLTVGTIQVPTGIPREKRAVPYALLGFDYGGHLLEYPARGSEELRYVDGRLVSICRSRSTEFAAVEVLLRRGLKQVAEAQHVPWQLQERLPDAAWILDQQRPSDTQIDTFLALKPLLATDGIVVRYDPSFPVELVAPPDEVIGEIVAADGQWFSLSLGINVDGRRIELLPVLAAALANRRFPLEPAPNEPDDAVWLAPLDERRRIPLPIKRVRELIAPLVELLTSIEPGATRVRVSRLRALALTRESEAVRWHGDSSVRRLLAALDDEGDRAEIAPPGLAATLRPYQAEGVRWLDRLGRAGLGGVLADDMGLGKTLQLIAYLLLRHARGDLAEPALVVAPTSVVPNWQAELARFAPGLRVLALRGTRRKADFARIGEHDIVLSSYALLPRDGDVLAERRWSVVVLDEAQWVKNPRTQAAQVARSLNAQHRLCLTGTPLENHLGELWAQFDFALPSLLGDEREFVRWYRVPIEKHRDLAKAELLARRISPFIKRRTKSEVAVDLPPKTVMVRTVELEGRQRELYESLRVAMHERVHEALARRGMAQSHVIVLDALLKLRQVCCDPRLVKLDAAADVQQSAKLDELVSMLEELVAEDRHTLVFSQFASMLELIAAALDAVGIRYEMLRGDTQDREAPVARFQHGDVKVFLISLKAGGVGLNLTAADTVIHYDPWWNPAAEEQATDRAHRIGQDKPVFVYKLIAAGTVEQKIQALQAKKAELASAILDEAIAAPDLLSEADIAELFD